MSKSANPGELRTPVFVFKITRTVNENGVPIEAETNVFGEGAYIRTKWINAHGTESFTALQLELREPATITCRYSPLIKRDCIIYKGDDPDPYEVISIDNVEERNRWLEIKVQRKENAR